MLLCCLIQTNSRCNVTAGVLLKSMTKWAWLEEEIGIEIRDDFDFEAVKTRVTVRGGGARLKCDMEMERIGCRWRW